jgi:hypothetical protein
MSWDGRACLAGLPRLAVTTEYDAQPNGAATASRLPINRIMPENLGFEVKLAIQETAGGDAKNKETGPTETTDGRF